jgi:ABC-type Zn2+ transport system substrate-binding protein/surface adhesin
VEQRHHVTAHRIYSREIGALPKVAAVAGQRKVVLVVKPAMLLRHDVLDVVGQPAVLLRQQAIFTAISCSPTDCVARSGIHR